MAAVGVNGLMIYLRLVIIILFLMSTSCYACCLLFHVDSTRFSVFLLGPKSIGTSPSADATVPPSID